MARLRRIKFTISLIITLTLIAPLSLIDAQDQSASLRSVFQPSSCKFVCWLSIEPEITSRAEVEQLFEQYNIAYETNNLTGVPTRPSEMAITFDIPLQFDLVFLDDWGRQASGAIYFWEDVVSMVQLPVRIPLDLFIQEFGYPSYVTPLGEDDIVEWVFYPEEGMWLWLTPTGEDVGLLRLSSQGGGGMIEAPDFTHVPVSIPTGTPSPQVLQARWSEPTYRYLLISEGLRRAALVYLNTQGYIIGTQDLPDAPDRFAYRPEMIEMSPNGQWLVTQQTTQPTFETQLQLIHLESGEVRSIVIPSLWGWSTGPQEPYQRLIWSPDSKYIAVLGIEENSPVDLWLYELETGNVFNLTDGTQDQHAFSWSSDSSRLAYVTDYCESPNAQEFACTTLLNVINIQTRQVEQRLDVSRFSKGFANPGTNVCDLRWSPDDRYIAFVAHCYNSTRPNPQSEVYLWDLRVDHLWQVTSFTEAAGSETDAATVQTDYHTYFQGDDTLLIGAWYSFLNGPIEVINQTQTVAYTIAENQLHILSPDAARYWSENPVTHEVIAGMYSPTRMNLDRNPVSRLETLDRDDWRMQLQYEITSGACDLEWNDIGDVLSYITYEDNAYCRGRIDYIGFSRHITDGAYTFAGLHPLPLKGVVVPLGWG